MSLYTRQRVTATTTFPEGQSVALYLHPAKNPGHAPFTEPITTRTFQNGQVIFENLPFDTEYTVYALVGSLHRYVDFRTGPAPRADGIDLSGAAAGDVLMANDDLGVSWERLPELNVRHPPFNALATPGAPIGPGGAVNDATAAIQAAIIAAGVAGGARVIIDDVFYLETITATAGRNVALFVYHDNVFLDFRGPGELRTTKNTSLLMWAGPARNYGVANIGTYSLQNGGGGRTYYGFDVVPSKYDRALTSATLAAAVSAAIAAGDKYPWLHIKTGQRTNNIGVFESQAETNQVTRVSGSTVTLRWPLAHSYLQEYYKGAGAGGLDGNKGKSDEVNRGVPANNGIAPYGVAIVSDLMLQNVGLINPKVDNHLATGATAFVHKGPTFGLHIHGLRGTYGGSPVDLIEWRHHRASDWDFLMDADTAYGTSARWSHTSATGCVDGVIEGGHAHGKGRVLNLHIHEDAAQVTYVDWHVNSEAGVDDDNILSIRGGAADVLVKDSSFISGGLLTPVFVSADCGKPGVLDNVFAKNADASEGIEIQGKRWTLRNIAPDVPVRVKAAANPLQTPYQPWWYWSWLSSTTQTVALGIWPENSTVLDVEVVCFEAFDSDAADNMSIGWTGTGGGLDDPNAILPSGQVDLSTTGPKRLLAVNPIIGSAAWDPANLVTGTSTSTTVTVAGAALGDRVVVSHSADTLGCSLAGMVTAANTVTVVLSNNTGADKNVASGTTRASVLKDQDAPKPFGGYFRIYNGPNFSDRPRVITAYYLNAGSEPTVGQALVGVCLCRIPTGLTA